MSRWRAVRLVSISSVAAFASCAGPARSLPSAQSLSVSLSPAMAPAGVPVVIQAIETLSDGSMRAPLGMVTWVSSDPTAATNAMTSSPDVFIGLKAGATVTITATTDDLCLEGVPCSASATFVVTAAEPLALSIDPPSATVPIGLSVPFAASAEFTDGSTHDVTAMTVWSVDNLSVATVGASTGVVTGIVASGASVTAKFMGPTKGASATAPISVISAVVTAIAVAPVPASQPAGVPQPFTATAQLSDGSTMDVTNAAKWTSSDPSYAYVSDAPSSPGVAIGLLPTTTPVSISAAYGGRVGTASFSVTNAILVSLVVAPKVASAPVGQTILFNATGTFSDHSMADVTTTVVWTASCAPASPCNVTNVGALTGLATALATGSAQVTATSSTNTSITANAALTVTPRQVMSIAMSCPACSTSTSTGTPTAPRVAVGASIQLEAQGSWSDGSSTDVTATATWDSDMASVATVSDASGTKGHVTGAGSGTANMLATVDATTGRIAVMVP